MQDSTLAKLLGAEGTEGIRPPMDLAVDRQLQA